MDLSRKNWTGRASWNRIDDGEVMRRTAKAAARCAAVGAVATLHQLRKYGASGDNPRIAWAREQLIASGKLSPEACAGKNRRSRAPAIEAAQALEAGAASRGPEPEPTPIGVEIRAAMKRERERERWTFAAPSAPMLAGIPS